jgi:HAD superfamily hydrolase (TIGR01459 family)
VQVEIIKNPAQLIEKYDLFLIDLWGVLHDGTTPFQGTLRFIEKLLDAKKNIVLLSNSPRPANYTAMRLEEMGISSKYYDDIVTSGTQCLNCLNNRTDDFYKSLGKHVYYYGPQRERGLIDSIQGYIEVKTLQEADFILMTSTLNWDDTIEGIDGFLKEALSLNLPIACANADFEVMHGGEKLICAGAIADAYHQMGGNVSIHGKPNASLYAMGHGKFPDISKERILMIGDSLRTDIKGANNFGIDSVLLVKHGVLGAQIMPFFHKDEFGHLMIEICDAYQAKPTYAVEEF